MQELKDKIKNLADHYYSDAVLWRRRFHAFPELAFEEYDTAAFIIEKLKSWGIKYQAGVAKTGIVAIIEGKEPTKKTVGFRADMDALPIHELGQQNWKSQRHGVMHACGHDVHMAAQLGAIRILNEIRNEFEGSIKLIFQPSEEKYPGGASIMIQEGVLENPKPDKMFGQHVLPTLDAGKVGMRSGKYMASTDEVFITVKGIGGHAATPELVIDPILIASHIIVALQQIVSRKAVPTIPTLLSFGRIIGQGRTNIIPDQVIIEGTFRTYDEVWRTDAHNKIRFMSETLAESMGGSAEVFIDRGYPFLVNDDETTRAMKDFAIEYLGQESVVDLEMRMTAEDFAYFSQQIPSCFYRIGSAKPGTGEITNLHTATFEVDESCILTGMGLMAWIAVNELARNGK